MSDASPENMSPEELAQFQKANCIFCQIGQGKIPAKQVYEDEHAIAVLDIHPATKGHMLLMPKEHHAVLMQAPDDLIEHLFLVAKGLSQAALKGLHAKGTTVFVANGVAAGQRAPHVMIHVIPRYEDDKIALTIPKQQIPASEMKGVRDMMRKTLGYEVKEKPKEARDEHKTEPKEAHDEKTQESQIVQESSKKKKHTKQEAKEFDLDKISGLFE